MSSTGRLSYLVRLLPRPGGDVETVNLGEERRALDVVGRDLDVVESVIVAGLQGVPALVGQAGGLHCQTVAHHHSLLPQSASGLSLELKVDNLSMAATSGTSVEWSGVSPGTRDNPGHSGTVKNPKSKHNSISAQEKLCEGHKLVKTKSIWAKIVPDDVTSF